MNNNKPQITVILGTAREGRQSAKVADYIFNILNEREEINPVLADIRDFLSKPATIPAWEENILAEPWRDLVKKTDAFILVSPEYNHSFPGELKMLIDQDLKNYKDKKILLAGVSAGNFGGTLAVESLIPILHKFGFGIISDKLFFPNVEELFANTEVKLDDIYLDKINKAIDNLIN